MNWRMNWRNQEIHTQRSCFAKTDYRSIRTAHLQVLARSGNRKTFRTWKRIQHKVWTFPVNRKLSLSDGYTHELSQQPPGPCTLPTRASLLWQQHTACGLSHWGTPLQQDQAALSLPLPGRWKQENKQGRRPGLLLQSLPAAEHLK